MTNFVCTQKNTSQKKDLWLITHRLQVRVRVSMNIPTGYLCQSLRSWPSGRPLEYRGGWGIVCSYCQTGDNWSILGQGDAGSESKHRRATWANISGALVGKWSGSWLREDCHWIWAWTSKVMLDTSLKVMQHQRIDTELPLQVQAHLPLHLVDLLKCKHPLTNNTPRLVRISVITYNLWGKH